jgi:hypothetical protein
MGRRLVGSLMFLGSSLFVFELASRLASQQRPGWGWFVFAALMLTGVALNIWTGDIPTPECSRCQKPYSVHDLE